MFCLYYVYTRVIHVLTRSVPTRRSSDLWNERILRGGGAEGVKWAAWVRRGVPGAARFGVGSRGAAVPGGSAVLKGFVQAVGWARGAGAALGLGAGEAVVAGRGGVAE